MLKLKKIHFTAVGSNNVASLAIALKQAGYTVTGSDVEFAPELRSKLLTNNVITDDNNKWSEENIDSGLDAVVTGPFVKSDNPEIKKALRLAIPVYSFSDFIYQLSTDQQRIVIAGSTGKASIVLMIMHVLKFHKRQFDYVLNSSPNKVSAQIHISGAPLIIIEGQDVMDSINDKKPAFLRYHHHIGLISGIEWQKSDIYPTKEEYIRQFEHFAEATPKGGIMIYFELDPVAAVLSKVNKTEVLLVPYKTHASDIVEGHEVLVSSEKKKITLKISGKHNLQSISAAKEVVKKTGITSEMFYQAISSFEGVA